MSVTTEQPSKTESMIDRTEVEDLLRESTQSIAPLWSLESFVTVNPYHGMIDEGFKDVARRLESVAGARTTMPESYYLDAYDSGEITGSALNAVLDRHETPPTDSVEELIRIARNDSPADASPDPTVPTVADVAADCTGRDWVAIETEQVSDWAAAYFDNGQVLWDSTAPDDALFQAWKREAEIDRTPDVLGLEGFRKAIQTLPDDSLEATREVFEELRVPWEGMNRYLHRLLLRVGGWSAYCSRIVFEMGLEGKENDSAIEFLSILLCWEYGLYTSLPEAGLDEAWQNARSKFQTSSSAEMEDRRKREQIFLEAYERSEQARLQDKLSARPSSSGRDDSRPAVQAVFCIDVRSEVYRRHFESLSEEVQTFGFPGFFAFPINFKPLGHTEAKKQCPPPLQAEYTVPEMLTNRNEHQEAVKKRTLKHHVKRAWQSFKWGAVTCFSFVGPVGLLYLPKIFADAFGLSRTVPHPDDESLNQKQAEKKEPVIEPDPHALNGTGIPPSDRLDLAEEALNAMSLTDGFARLVMITGHGATTVNNPYDSAYDCGACGGNAGNANARVAAKILNDPDVRDGLAERGIDVPEDTFFLAARHNTTTDEISLLNRSRVPESHENDVKQLETWLDEATQRTIDERAERFNLSSVNETAEQVQYRSRDWSQVRPEWGLAGNSSFIVAPRERTRGIDLEGRTFLHNYDWTRDDDFEVLELIMTAPMVVTTWISLQYYASTVENDLFGSGNKTLHNVVGRLGVFEGNAGDLRTGLPWQSIHDGDTYQHVPLRQSVVIEAPINPMNEIIDAHETVRHLCDNNWLHLLKMGDDGTITHRYEGDLNWTETSLDKPKQGN